MIRTLLIYLATITCGIIFFASMVLVVIPALQESPIALLGLTSSNSKNGNTVVDKESIEAEINKLQKKLDSHTPTDAFLIVNTSENHFYLYKGKELIRHGLCSSGKNERLISQRKKGKKEYVFYTPKGVRKVQRKQKIRFGANQIGLLLKMDFPFLLRETLPVSNRELSAPTNLSWATII